MLFFSSGFSFRCFGFDQLTDGEVIGIDPCGTATETTVVNFVKPDDDVLFDAALIDRDDATDILEPVGFFPEDANL